jgi:hypothetical protein
VSSITSTLTYQLRPAYLTYFPFPMTYLRCWFLLVLWLSGSRGMANPSNAPHADTLVSGQQPFSQQQLANLVLFARV